MFSNGILGKRKIDTWTRIRSVFLGYDIEKLEDQVKAPFGTGSLSKVYDFWTWWSLAKSCSTESSAYRKTKMTIAAPIQDFFSIISLFSLLGY